MSDLISLLLMISMPVMLFMGVKARARKQEIWKMYLIATGCAFVALIVVTKIMK